MIKTLIIWICSFLIAGIIISPFFWLRFLKEKSRWRYVSLSSLLTLIFFYFSTTVIYDFILKYIHHYNQLDYFDGISMGSIYIVLLLIITSPFIFTKIIYDKINIRSFFISLIISIAIIVTYAFIFVYIIFPMAVGGIFKALN